MAIDKFAHKVVKTESDIKPKYGEWSTVKSFDEKGKIVDEKGRIVGNEHQGHRYRIIAKRERAFSTLERLGRGALGTVAVVFTFSLALSAKPIRHLFVKSKENILFSTEVSEAALAQADPAQKQAAPAQKEEIQKVLPLVEVEAKKVEDFIEKSRAAALDTFRKATPQESAPDFTLSQEQKNSLLEANSKKDVARAEAPLELEGVKIIRGGANSVIFLESVPGFVFKPMRDQQAAIKYINVTNQARSVVSDKKLYLLHVPESKLVEVDGNYFVMQEEADLISGKSSEAGGVYSYYWNDKEMNDYMKAVFKQMLEFIAETGFSDVKYDNIPLTVEGRVALVDLDRDSVIKGLTKGGVDEENNGLLNYIPAEHLDEFLLIAKGKLKDLDRSLLLPMIEGIKAKIDRRVERNEAYSRFCQENKISFASQSINPKLPKIFDDEKKQAFATSIVACLNEDLSRSKNFSLRTGRRVFFPTAQFSDRLFIEASKIWPDIPLIRDKPGEFVFEDAVTEVLDGLKNSGYIHKYKKGRNFSSVAVTC